VPIFLSLFHLEKERDLKRWNFIIPSLFSWGQDYFNNSASKKRKKNSNRKRYMYIFFRCFYFFSFILLLLWFFDNHSSISVLHSEKNSLLFCFFPQLHFWWEMWSNRCAATHFPLLLFPLLSQTPLSFLSKEIKAKDERTKEEQERSYTTIHGPLEWIQRLLFFFYSAQNCVFTQTLFWFFCFYACLRFFFLQKTTAHDTCLFFLVAQTNCPAGLSLQWSAFFCFCFKKWQAYLLSPRSAAI